MLCAALFSFYLQSAKDVFNLLLQIGAGTGLLFILRWFWSRINPYSEIAAMAISFLIAVFFFVNSKLSQPFVNLEGHWQLVIGVIITTLGWITVTLLTKPTKKETLDKFNSLIFGQDSKFKGFRMKIIGFLAGVLGVYSALFSIGNFIYGEIIFALVLLIITLICGLVIIKSFKTL